MSSSEWGVAADSPTSLVQFIIDERVRVKLKHM